MQDRLAVCGANLCFAVAKAQGEPSSVGRKGEASHNTWLGPFAEQTGTFCGPEADACAGGGGHLPVGRQRHESHGLHLGLPENFSSGQLPKPDLAGLRGPGEDAAVIGQFGAR